MERYQLKVPAYNTPINYNVMVQDNYMPEDYCDYLIREMTQNEGNFPWYWGDVLYWDTEFSTINCAPNKNWQLSHVFYLFGVCNSDWNQLLQPLIDTINPDVLYRVKSNLNPYEEQQTVHGYHTDENIPGVTSIFYINSNDGKTILRVPNPDADDGYEYQEIESKRNRLVTFDNRIFHSGTGTTNEKFRLVLNLNYYKHDLALQLGPEPIRIKVPQ